MRKRLYKTLGTGEINSPMTPDVSLSISMNESYVVEKFGNKTRTALSNDVMLFYLFYKDQVIFILVCIRNRLISGGLEPVLIHAKKLCLASYYIQFSTNIHSISAEICL